LQKVRTDTLSNVADSAYLASHTIEIGRQTDGAIRAKRAAMDAQGIDDLSERVIGAAITVHSTLGPGLLESVYRDCLAIELRHLDIPFDLEARFPIVYRGTRVRDSLRIDVLVDRRLVLEIKVVERLHPVFKAQVITYLKIADCPAGLVLNFNAVSLRAGLQRVDHPEIYAEKRAARRGHEANSIARTSAQEEREREK
jgi:GxxExxY protein